MSPAASPADRIVWVTSGQANRPMPWEVAYAGAEAMLAGFVRTVPGELVDRGILLNAVNPGPVNTGYLDEETTDRPERLEAIRAAFPWAGSGTPPIRLA